MSNRYDDDRPSRRDDFRRDDFCHGNSRRGNSRRGNFRRGNSRRGNSRRGNSCRGRHTPYNPNRNGNGPYYHGSKSRDHHHSGDDGQNPNHYTSSRSLSLSCGRNVDSRDRIEQRQDSQVSLTLESPFKLNSSPSFDGRDLVRDQFSIDQREIAIPPCPPEASVDFGDEAESQSRQSRAIQRSSSSSFSTTASRSSSTASNSSRSSEISSLTTDSYCSMASEDVPATYARTGNSSEIARLLYDFGKNPLPRLRRSSSRSSYASCSSSISSSSRKLPKTYADCMNGDENGFGPSEKASESPEEDSSELASEPMASSEPSVILPTSNDQKQDKQQDVSSKRLILKLYFGKLSNRRPVVVELNETEKTCDEPTTVLSDEPPALEVPSTISSVSNCSEQGSSNGRSRNHSEERSTKVKDAETNKDEKLNSAVKTISDLHKDEHLEKLSKTMKNENLKLPAPETSARVQSPELHTSDRSILVKDIEDKKLNSVVDNISNLHEDTQLEKISKSPQEESLKLPVSRFTAELRSPGLEKKARHSKNKKLKQTLKMDGKKDFDVPGDIVNENSQSQNAKQPETSRKLSISKYLLTLVREPASVDSNEEKHVHDKPSKRSRNNREREDSDLELSAPENSSAVSPVADLSERFLSDRKNRQQSEERSTNIKDAETNKDKKLDSIAQNVPNLHKDSSEEHLPSDRTRHHSKERSHVVEETGLDLELTASENSSASLSVVDRSDQFSLHRKSRKHSKEKSTNAENSEAKEYEKLDSVAKINPNLHKDRSEKHLPCGKARHHSNERSHTGGDVAMNGNEKLEIIVNEVPNLHKDNMRKVGLDSELVASENPSATSSVVDHSEHFSADRKSRKHSNKRSTNVKDIGSNKNKKSNRVVDNIPDLHRDEHPEKLSKALEEKSLELPAPETLTGEQSPELHTRDGSTLAQDIETNEEKKLNSVVDNIPDLHEDAQLEKISKSPQKKSLKSRTSKMTAKLRSPKLKKTDRHSKNKKWKLSRNHGEKNDFDVPGAIVNKNLQSRKAKQPKTSRKLSISKYLLSLVREPDSVDLNEEKHVHDKKQKMSRKSSFGKYLLSLVRKSASTVLEEGKNICDDSPEKLNDDMNGGEFNSASQSSEASINYAIVDSSERNSSRERSSKHSEEKIMNVKDVETNGDKKLDSVVKDVPDSRKDMSAGHSSKSPQKKSLEPPVPEVWIIEQSPEFEIIAETLKTNNMKEGDNGSESQATKASTSFAIGDRIKEYLSRSRNQDQSKEKLTEVKDAESNGNKKLDSVLNKIPDLHEDTRPKKFGEIVQEEYFVQDNHYTMPKTFVNQQFYKREKCAEEVMKKPTLAINHEGKDDSGFVDALMNDSSESHQDNQIDISREPPVLETSPVLVDLDEAMDTRDESSKMSDRVLDLKLAETSTNTGFIDHREGCLSDEKCRDRSEVRSTDAMEAEMNENKTLNIAVDDGPDMQKDAHLENASRATGPAMSHADECLSNVKSRDHLDIHEEESDSNDAPQKKNRKPPIPEESDSNGAPQKVNWKPPIPKDSDSNGVPQEGNWKPPIPEESDLNGAPQEESWKPPPPEDSDLNGDPQKESWKPPPPDDSESNGDPQEESWKPPIPKYSDLNCAQQKENWKPPPPEDSESNGIPQKEGWKPPPPEDSDLNGAPQEESWKPPPPEDSESKGIPQKEGWKPPPPEDSDLKGAPQEESWKPPPPEDSDLNGAPQEESWKPPPPEDSDSNGAPQEESWKPPPPEDSESNGIPQKEGWKPPPPEDSDLKGAPQEESWKPPPPEDSESKGIPQKEGWKPPPPEDSDLKGAPQEESWKPPPPEDSDLNGAPQEESWKPPPPEDSDSNGAPQEESWKPPPPEDSESNGIPQKEGWKPPPPEDSDLKGAPQEESWKPPPPEDSESKGIPQKEGWKPPPPEDSDLKGAPQEESWKPPPPEDSDLNGAPQEESWKPPPPEDSDLKGAPQEESWKPPPPEDSDLNGAPQEESWKPPPPEDSDLNGAPQEESWKPPPPEDSDLNGAPQEESWKPPPPEDSESNGIPQKEGWKPPPPEDSDLKGAPQEESWKPPPPEDSESKGIPQKEGWKPPPPEDSDLKGAPQEESWKPPPPEDSESNGIPQKEGWKPPPPEDSDLKGAPQEESWKPPPPEDSESKGIPQKEGWKPPPPEDSDLKGAPQEESWKPPPPEDSDLNGAPQEESWKPPPPEDSESKGMPQKEGWKPPPPEDSDLKGAPQEESWKPPPPEDSESNGIPQKEGWKPPIPEDSDLKDRDSESRASKAFTSHAIDDRSKRFSSSGRNRNHSKKRSTDVKDAKMNESKKLESDVNDRLNSHTDTSLEKSSKSKSRPQKKSSEPTEVSAKKESPKLGNIADHLKNKKLELAINHEEEDDYDFVGALMNKSSESLQDKKLDVSQKPPVLKISLGESLVQKLVAIDSNNAKKPPIPEDSDSNGAPQKENWKPPVPEEDDSVQTPELERNDEQPKIEISKLSINCNEEIATDFNSALADKESKSHQDEPSERLDKGWKHLDSKSRESEAPTSFAIGDCSEAHSSHLSKAKNTREESLNKLSRNVRGRDSDSESRASKASTSYAIDDRSKRSSSYGRKRNHSKERSTNIKDAKMNESKKLKSDVNDHSKSHTDIHLEKFSKSPQKKNSESPEVSAEVESPKFGNIADHLKNKKLELAMNQEGEDDFDFVGALMKKISESLQDKKLNVSQKPVVLKISLGESLVRKLLAVDSNDAKIPPIPQDSDLNGAPQKESWKPPVPEEDDSVQTPELESNVEQPKIENSKLPINCNEEFASNFNGAPADKSSESHQDHSSKKSRCNTGRGGRDLESRASKASTSHAIDDRSKRSSSYGRKRNHSKKRSTNVKDAEMNESKKLKSDVNDHSKSHTDTSLEKSSKSKSPQKKSLEPTEVSAKVESPMLGKIADHLKNKKLELAMNQEGEDDFDFVGALMKKNSESLQDKKLDISQKPPVLKISLGESLVQKLIAVDSNDAKYTRDDSSNVLSDNMRQRNLDTASPASDGPSASSSIVDQSEEHVSFERSRDDSKERYNQVRDVETDADKNQNGFEDAETNGNKNLDSLVNNISDHHEDTGSESSGRSLQKKSLKLPAPELGGIAEHVKNKKLKQTMSYEEENDADLLDAVAKNNSESHQDKQLIVFRKPRALKISLRKSFDCEVDSVDLNEAKNTCEEPSKEDLNSESKANEPPTNHSTGKRSDESSSSGRSRNNSNEKSINIKDNEINETQKLDSVVDNIPDSKDNCPEKSSQSLKRKHLETPSSEISASVPFPELGSVAEHLKKLKLKLSMNYDEVDELHGADTNKDSEGSEDKPVDLFRKPRKSKISLRKNLDQEPVSVDLDKAKNTRDESSKRSSRNTGRGDHDSESRESKTTTSYAIDDCSKRSSSYGKKRNHSKKRSTNFEDAKMNENGEHSNFHTDESSKKPSGSTGRRDNDSESRASKTSTSYAIDGRKRRDSSRGRSRDSSEERLTKVKDVKTNEDKNDRVFRRKNRYPKFNKNQQWEPSYKEASASVQDPKLGSIAKHLKNKKLKLAMNDDEEEEDDYDFVGALANKKSESNQDKQRQEVSEKPQALKFSLGKNLMQKPIFVGLKKGNERGIKRSLVDDAANSKRSKYCER